MKIFFFTFLFLSITVSLEAQCDNWSLISASADWRARAGLQAAELNGTFYILGGRTPKPPSNPAIPGDSEIWNDVWSSQDKGLTWNGILNNDTTGSHWPARAYFQALAKNDSIYVIGGQNYKVVINPTDSSLVSKSDFFNDVWRSPDGIIWEQMTDSAGWSGRAGLSAVVYNNEIYVMGGSVNDDAAIIGGPPKRIYYNDVWKSSDGRNWQLLTDSASWAPRAGGVAVVKDNYIYMIGGEEGFICLSGGPCPPYFNDVWRSQNGVDWEIVTDSAGWAKRPGHQCVVADDLFVLFGGFGLNPQNLFAPANPIDVWVSNDGAEWTMLSNPPWNATLPTEIKYDFDALVFFNNDSARSYIYTFGGDRETFNFTDTTNYRNVDNDVWKFCVPEISTSTADQFPNQQFRIYPNPTSSRLTIVTEENVLKVKILDMAGKTLKSYNEVSNIEISSLLAGSYLFQVQTSLSIHNARIVKQ